VPPDSNRLVGIDAAVIAAVSLAICLASRNLILMTVLVPGLFLARIVAVAAVSTREGVNLRAELVFLLVCTVLGGFNDWNSVCNKRIYDYTVPRFFSFATIPLWMLLYGGMILRFVARLARWQALSPPRSVSDRLGVGAWRVDSGTIKVAAELGLVLATRQTIYRLYLDPVLSWLPFLAALAVFFLLFRPDRHDGKLLLLFLAGGPLIEILYIRVGGLHAYHLGWIGGVPLWIALWWLLIVLIWKDIAFRLERFLRSRFA